MTQSIESRLAQLGIELPQPAAPAAAYVPTIRTGNLVYVSGQLPVWNGEIRFKGKVGATVTVEQAQEAARLCALNLLAQVHAACGGSLDAVRRCVKLGGFVASGPDFYDHPKVVNGASQLMLDVLGDAGRHARFAVGAPALPFDVPVEVDAVFEVA
ncbi:RidA family protein [Arenibaculum pallidiluteum]|uniref:RidA family protein n=1 Tax=Arenibaculum pallidiluteum TaxID=2812559 RepID=UPI001A959ACF|nr:RidA family protein [Arenibaculum pallidiluteum]